MNCPACGVPVVPGYARCPRCHGVLPQRPATTVEGGTAVDPPRRIPLAAVIGAGVVGLAVILWLGLRGGGDDTKPPAPAPAPAAAAPAPPARPDLAPAPDLPPERPRARSADDVAADLERTLKRQRLWSTVSVTGARVEVRSGSCSDPAIQAPIAAATAGFKAAGLTRLRCVEQSGAVVFTRDL